MRTKKSAPKLGRKGFTLVEMVTALAVLVILTSGIATLMEPSMRIYMDGTNQARGKRIADDVAELVVGELLYAKELELSGPWPSDAPVTGNATAKFISAAYGEMTLSQDDGRPRMLHALAGELSFGEDYYMGNHVFIGMTLRGRQLTLEVVVTNERDTVIARREQVLTLLNLTA